MIQNSPVHDFNMTREIIRLAVMLCIRLTRLLRKAKTCFMSVVSGSGTNRFGSGTTGLRRRSQRHSGAKQPCADMTVGQPDGLSKCLGRGALTGLHARPLVGRMSGSWMRSNLGGAV